MRNLKFLGYLMIFASGLLFFQCTSSDPIYVAGEDGRDGIDGVDGVDGSAAVCIDCHANSHRAPIEAAWEDSRHGFGGTWAARGTIGSCASCHNSDGFIDIVSGRYVDEEGFNTTNPDGYAVGYSLDCTGCHTDHRSFDFENDGNDYALRTIAPVKLFLDRTYELDLTNSVDELGLSNLCVNCHQPRPSYPIPAGTEDYEITSSRFGPHHGPQSTMLEGIMGANIPGSEGYPGVASATHRTAASCTSCHMNDTYESDGELYGSHTWRVDNNSPSCVACHTNGAPEELSGFSEDMATLKALLLAFDPSPLLENDRTVPGTYPADVAKATWNYRTLLEDQSHGVHNPAYTRALLKNSIEALQD